MTEFPRKDSGIIGRESMSFEDDDKYYTIQVTTQMREKP